MMRSLGTIARLSLVAATSAVSLGCAMSAGAVYHRTADTSPDGNGIAGRLGGITKFGRDEGVALGWDGEVGYRAGRSALLAPELGRIHGLVGWSSSPLPYRPSPVGLELLAAVGIGHFARDERVVHGVSFGPRVGVPIRLVRRTQLWDSQEKIGLTPMLVPSVEWSFVSPTDGGEPRELRSELGVGLSLRYHLWSALIP